MQYADCFESSMLPSIMESRMFQKEYIREMARQQARYDFSKNAGVYANEIASSMLQSSVGEQVGDEGKKEQVPVGPLDEKMLLRQIEAGKVFPRGLVCFHRRVVSTETHITDSHTLPDGRAFAQRQREVQQDVRRRIRCLLDEICQQRHAGICDPRHRGRCLEPCEVPSADVKRVSISGGFLGASCLT